MKKAIFLFFLLFNTSFGLSLDKAINLSLKNHPYLKQQKSYLFSSRYDYYSTFGNFFPSVTLNFSYAKFMDVYPSDYFSRGLSLNINWTIYSSGQNILLNRIKEKLFRANQESYREDVLDVIYQVKKAYYTAVAKREIWKVRKFQLKAAEKNYQMARKKLKLGLVTKADYLQAKVRLENVRYSLLNAENDFRKSLAELCSLIGYPLSCEVKLDTSVLDNLGESSIPSFEKLEKIAFNRPVFRQYRYEIKSAKLQSIQALSTFTPSVFVSYSLNRDYSSISGSSDSYSILRFGLSWTIFEGLKRYYSYLSAKENERFYRYRLKELKRQIKLSLYNLYLDLKTSYKNLKVSKELLKQAEENYRQALGEYRVGKGDIISLVTAESSLASAHETYINSLLNIAVTKSVLEREMGIKSLPLEGKKQ
ncbi:TolC family protein [Persephonella atlantica]|uniref:TolC family protein n=1 Tax=Persephonella atlantica TaxID=2699429 RepID=A0ABS1GF83_9AQUI|nr:TolC family protein [Persephonella atlantica]MBK3331592.1 TolC family protein [Persephonella atlantica]